MIAAKQYFIKSMKEKDLPVSDTNADAKSER